MTLGKKLEDLSRRMVAAQSKEKRVLFPLLPPHISTC